MDLQISQEIAGPDPSKIPALFSLIQQLANGVDVSRYTPAVLKYCLESCDNKQCRRLSYQVLCGGSLEIDDMPVFAKAVIDDLKVDDLELRVYAIKAILSIAQHAAFFKTFFNENRAVLLQCVRSGHTRVRQAAIEVIGHTLVQHLASCSSELFIFDDFLRLLTDVCADENPFAAHSAFGLLRSVVCTVFGDPTSQLQVLKPGVVTERGVFSYVTQYLQAASARLPDMLARFSSMETHLRHVAVWPLAILSLLKKGSDFNSLHMFIEQHVVPGLSSADTTLVLESAYAVLFAATNLKTAPVPRHWAHAAASALLGLTKRADYRSSCEDIAKAVCALLPMMHDQHKYIVCIKLLQALEFVSDYAVRLLALESIFREFVLLSLRSAEAQTETELQILLRDLTFVSITYKKGTTLREDAIACLCDAVTQVYDESFGSLPSSGTAVFPQRSVASPSSAPSAPTVEVEDWITIALDVLEFCKPCMTWATNGRTHAHTAYLLLIRRLCRLVLSVEHPPEDDEVFRKVAKQSNNILGDVFGKLPQIPSEPARVQALSLLSQFLNLRSPTASDESTDDLFESLKIILSKLSKRGGQGHLLDLLVDSVLSLCARHPRLLVPGQEFLESLLRKGAADPSATHCVSAALQKIVYVQEQTARGSLAAGSIPSLYGFGLEDTDAAFTMQFGGADDAFLQGLALAHDLRAQMRSYLDPPNRAADPALYPFEPCLGPHSADSVPAGKLSLVRSSVGYGTRQATEMISAPNDPFGVQAQYIIHPTRHQIILRLRITNETSNDVRGLRVTIGTSGSLVYMESATRASRRFGALAPSHTHEWVSEFAMTSWDRPSFHVTLYFSRSQDETPALSKSSRRDESNSVTLRCRPLHVAIDHVMRPIVATSFRDFTRMWTSLPSSARLRVVHDAKHGPSFSSRCLSKAPFFEVARHLFNFKTSFQSAHSAMTIFGDPVLLTIFGTLDKRRGRFVLDLDFRGPSEAVTSVIGECAASWVEDLSAGRLKPVEDGGQGPASDEFEVFEVDDAGKAEAEGDFATSTASDDPFGAPLPPTSSQSDMMEPRRVLETWQALRKQVAQAALAGAGPTLVVASKSSTALDDDIFS